MKRILPLVLAIAALSARANVLVYEGFHPADYNNVAAGGNAAAGDTSFTPGHTVGISSAKWNKMEGTQVRVFGENFGLALPAEMTGEGFTALGGAIGLNPSSNSSQHRGMSHALAANALKVSSGTLYVRVLLNLDSTAAGKLGASTSLTQKDGGYFGFGFGKDGGKNYYAPTSYQSALSFVIWKNSNNQYVLSFAHTTASGGTFTSYPLVTGITLGTTYICFAEVKVGAGDGGKEILRAGAMPADAYTTNTPWAALDGESDSVEVELITDSNYPTVMDIAGPYGTNKGYFLADEIVVGTTIEDILLVSTTKPKLSDGALTLANGVYTASAALAQSAADVTYTLSDGDEATTETPAPLGAGFFAADSTVAGTFPAPSDNTTHEVILTATNAAGETDELSLGTVYGGTLSLTKVSDADEHGLTPATLTVSRADSDPLPLVVNYSFADGTAVAGVNYLDDADSVTIPAGQSSATILVHPLVDVATETDTTMTVYLAAGNYTAPVAVAVTIANFTTPVGDNYWMGGTATGGKFLASTAANWSTGHAPTATENIYFDGNYSSADCEWDAAATATVASWTQMNGYAGVITLNTVYPGKGDFQCLTVTGPMAIRSGTITHPQSRTQSQSVEDYLQDLLDNETYRVRIDAGSLTVGAEGRIDARNKGYYHSNSGNHTSPLPSHGGWFGASGQAPYDNLKEPVHIGMPYKRASGTYTIGIGGGAIYLTSAGAVVVDGFIGADTGSDTWNRGLTLRAGGSGGSVYVRGASITGTGTISASALKTDEQNYRGVGGRVAVISTSTTPVDYTTLQLKATVYPFNNNNGQSTTYGSCGTVFVKDATQTYGTLLIQNVGGIFAPTVDRCTPVTTEGDWTFDSIGLGNRAVLSVPVGTALHLPDGLDSVFSLSAAGSAAYGSIRYEGGTLDLGSSTDQTVNGNWMLTPWTNLTVNADITVKGGGAIGVPAMADILDNDDAAGETAQLPTFVSCNLTVSGDLTVESDGILVAKQCGLKKYQNSVNSGFRGVLPGHTHGGRCLFFKGFDAQLRYYTGYDSVFVPCLPGNSVPFPNGQSAESSGGVITLAVTGTLTLDGEANANGMLETYVAGANCSGGTGGAIDITAGSLCGAGRILAEAGSKQAQRGSGGRIAVKLTSRGADFSDFSGTISASGRVLGSGDPADSSAGTVYLQTAADGDKGGTVTIAMSAGNQAVNNTNTTEMVSLGYGGDAVADYKRVSYVIRDYGRAAVNTDFAARTVTIADANSSIDLEGNELTVTDFAYAETSGETPRIVRLPVGVYDWSALQGYAWAVDSSAEKTGRLVVHGSATVIVLH